MTYPVEQCDREAAAALAEWHSKVAGEWEAVNGGTMQWFTADFPAAVRRGIWDNHDFVQAFAAHRIAERERCAKVAEDRKARADFAAEHNAAEFRNAHLAEADVSAAIATTIRSNP